MSTGMEEDQQLGILVKQNIVVDRGTNGALNALVDYKSTVRNNFNQHIGPEKALNVANEAGIFCFSRQFSFCFQVSHFIPIYNKEDFHYEHHYRH